MGPSGGAAVIRRGAATPEKLGCWSAVEQIDAEGIRGRFGHIKQQHEGGGTSLQSQERLVHMNESLNRRCRSPPPPLPATVPSFALSSRRSSIAPGHLATNAPMLFPHDSPDRTAPQMDGPNDIDCRDSVLLLILLPSSSSPRIVIIVVVVIVIHHRVRSVVFFVHNQLHGRGISSRRCRSP